MRSIPTTYILNKTSAAITGKGGVLAACRRMAWYQGA
jgi:hypothetical protein